MDNKRIPILSRLRISVAIILIIGLSISILTGIFGIFDVSKYTIDKTRNDTKDRIEGVLDDKLEICTLQLSYYANYAKEFATFINNLYIDPDKYISDEIRVNISSNNGIYSKTRYFLDESVDYDSVFNEIIMMNTLEDLWKPILENDDQIMKSLYIATESGFMEIYRKNQYYTPTGKDDYYNYKERPWYKKAKEAGTVIYTDVYDGHISDEKFVTCAAPFYNASGDFAGVVCIDLSTQDVYKNIVDIHMGVGNFSFIVDGSGTVIASDEFEHPDTIYDIEAFSDDTITDIMNRGTGSLTLNTGDYCVYAPAGDYNFEVVFIISYQLLHGPTLEVHKRLRNVIITYIIVIIGLLVLMHSMVSRISKSITKPIIELNNDINIIKNGDLDYQATIYNNDEIGDAANSFNEMALALKEYINNLTVVTAEKEHIKTELDIAQKIQKSILPSAFPAFPDRNDLDIFGMTDPAKEVGGDFFDFFLIDDDHLAMCIADVSGKGIPAAMFMMMSKILISSGTKVNTDPSQILSHVNNELCNNNQEMMFVTAWLGILEISTGKLVASNAGHEYPVIQNPDGEYKLYKDEHNIVLGVAENMEFSKYEISLQPGCSIFLYTDGVAEGINTKDEQYGTDRILNILNASKGNTIDAKGMADTVLSDLQSFTSGAEQFDDITILAFRYK
ncbi:MAG: SpoIIE family protein phosphatase [Butyrivibrio sp.]|nr:SpoIIE family protein phosphatase [Butyrivibrio sp.]